MPVTFLPYRNFAALSRGSALFPKVTPHNLQRRFSLQHPALPLPLTWPAHPTTPHLQDSHVFRCFVQNWRPFNVPAASLTRWKRSMLVRRFRRFSPSGHNESGKCRRKVRPPLPPAELQQSKAKPRCVRLIVTRSGRPDHLNLPS